MAVLSNPKHEAFAQQYAANGNATQSYITAGYSEKGSMQCASRLLRNAKVRARITEIQGKIARGALKVAIADRVSRVAALDDRWKRMQRVIDARAVHETMQAAPGGDTGLLVRQLKKIGSGEDAEIVEEFAVDTGLLKEMRAHEQQAAQELGQWEQGKSEQDAKEVPPFVVEIAPETESE